MELKTFYRTFTRAARDRLPSARHERLAYRALVRSLYDALDREDPTASDVRAYGLVFQVASHGAEKPIPFEEPTDVGGHLWLW